MALAERPYGVIQTQVRSTNSRQLDPFESMTVMSSGMVEFLRMRVLENASKKLKAHAEETNHPWLRRLLTMKENEIDREIIATAFLFDAVEL